MLLRSAGAGDAVRRYRRLSSSPRLSVDAAVVPGLLLLVARDLALFDPPRVLAWRLLHDPRLAELPGWLGRALPTPSGTLDRDPIALVLAALATLLALAYTALAVFRAAPATRAAVIAAAAASLVVLPSAAFVAMGVATDRPYGQDGGVVQLPLALDRILAGESPYGADYSGTILAKQARVSSFWEEYGDNPILHHHAYLPGTHLVMMPFHLASHAVLGFFDPRFVTLLFYALAVALAARVPESEDGRLVAAALVALNPLVYWHQIFGANDLVFVAMVLAAVLAARRGRVVAAGAILGLACATKQLAWPFAPFLLVAVSGARGFRDLLTPAPWRRVAAPLAAAGLVFGAVVLPVAALDFRAFWADIVVYNMGLSGGDSYPLGGTPGIGFLNFLIYLGGVTSLRDHVSLSFLYVLLVPLGLFLLHRQMREGAPEMALVTGSVALVASVYVSRVVHPNYLVAAAVLLPVGVLARRIRSDVALVPLLLLLLAVDLAAYAVLRTTWEQALAADLPARLGGLTAALAPRAGPSLTKDPLGAVFSATAVGLAVVYLAAGIAGAGRRTRAALVWVTAGLVVVLPILVIVGVGDRTGFMRAQDPRVVQAAGDAKRLSGGRSPYTLPPEDTPRGRQAFSTSFRLEPPAEIRPDRPLLPPTPSVLAALGRLGGIVDVRVPTLLALLALALVASSRVGGERGPAALGLVLLSAPLALGTTLGSLLALPLLALVAAAVLAFRGHARAAGVLAGLAAGLDHRAAFVAPLLLVPLAATPGMVRRSAAYAVAAYGTVVLPVVFLDPTAFGTRLVSVAPPGPGLGVFNLLAYVGVEGSAPAVALASLVPFLVALGILGLLRCRRPPLALAGLATLAGLVLSPSLPADAVAAPLVLLGLAATGLGVTGPGGTEEEA